MARQKIIHLHTSGLTSTSSVLTEAGDYQLSLGEIAVQHNATEPKLYIRLSSSVDGSGQAALATFVDQTKVSAMISEAGQTATDGIAEIKTIIGNGFTTANTITSAMASEHELRVTAEEALANDIADVSSSLTAVSAIIGEGFTSASTIADQLGAEVTRATGAEEALDGRLDTLEPKVATIEDQLFGLGTGSGDVKTYIDNATSAIADSLEEIEAASPANDYVTVTVGTKSDKKQSIGVAVAVKDVSASTASTEGLADAYDVKQELASRDTTIGNHTTDLATIKGQLSGISATDGAVKDYVDNQISAAITSVYKVKGSVATYEDLPATGNIEGDVYNVVAAYGNYPAGTNFVWVDGQPDGEWDPLGGAIDLSSYLQTSAFTAYTAATDTRIGSAESDILTVSGDVETEYARAFSAETALDDRLDAVEAAIGSGQIAQEIEALQQGLSAETVARTNADTALTQSIGTNASNISDLQDALGSGFSQSNTVRAEIDALSSTADSAVQSVVVDNTATNGITATKSGTTVTLDFDEMVIDCGTYGQS